MGGSGGTGGSSGSGGSGGTGGASTGDLDPAYGTNGVAKVALPNGPWTVQDVAMDSTNRMLIVGAANNDFIVVRLLPTGQVDTSFGTAGVFQYDRASRSDGANAVAVDSANNVYVAGGTRTPLTLQPDLTVLKLTPNGTQTSVTHLELDSQATTSHGPQDIAIDSVGRVVVTSWDRIGGSGTSGLSVWRLSSNLGVDATFGEFASGVSHWTKSKFSNDPTYSISIGTTGEGSALGIDAQDRPVLTARWSTSAGPDGPMLIRVTTAGLLDSTFGDDVYPSDGKPDGAWRPLDGTNTSWIWYSVLPGPGGVTYVSGQHSSAGPNTAAIWRVTAAGAPDTTFAAPNGYAGWVPPSSGSHPAPSDFAFHVARDSSGRLVAAGTTWLPGQTGAIFRASASGQFDKSFGLDGRAEFSSHPSALTGLRHVHMDATGGIIGTGWTSTHVSTFRVLP